MEVVERKTPQTGTSTPGPDPSNHTELHQDDHVNWGSHEWHSGDHASDALGPSRHNHTLPHQDHHMDGDGHEWHAGAPPAIEEPRLPDESGWYLPSGGHRDHDDHGVMTARTGAVLTSAAVGILVLGVVLIVLLVVFYRRRRMVARRQAVLAKAQRNLCVSGLGMDNPTYIVPLNGDDKKLGLDVTTMVSASDYPALLDQCAPPSYQQATADHGASSPNYSLEPDDNPEQVPVLRRLSITLPEDHGTDPNKTEHEV